MYVCMYESDEFIQYFVYSILGAAFYCFRLVKYDITLHHGLHSGGHTWTLCDVICESANSILWYVLDVIAKIVFFLNIRIEIIIVDSVI